MSWYLKYRPRQITDLDLTDVRNNLRAMMTGGRFPQTLLFAGPKGTGKTSASRIIGAMLNDPTNEEAVEEMYFSDKKKSNKDLQEPQPDSDFAQKVFAGHSYVVQEMDAASNRGIDDVRQLKERISLPPQQGKMAVYILDEVHMLTNEAFNALLKILEEPPAHVVFILATTELHKVPPTIVSRCSLVSFHKASLNEMVGRLEKILSEEEIEYEQEALEEIARRADGSFRDAVKLAEIASQSGQITLEEIDALIGGSALVEVKKLTKAVLAKDEVFIASIFQDLRQRNFDQDYFYQSLYGYLHQNILAAIGVLEKNPDLDQKVARFLLRQIMVIDLKQSTPIPFLPLELKLLAIVQRALAKSGGGNEGNKKNKDQKQTADKEEKQPVAKKKTEPSTQESQQQDNQQQSKEFVQELTEEDQLEHENPLCNKSEVIVTDGSLSKKLCKHWEDFLGLVQKRNSTLAALLRSSQPKSGSNGTAKINVFYQFHREQLQQPKFKALIEKCGEKIVGEKIGFKIVLSNTPTNADLVDVPAKTEKLEAIAKEALM